MSVVSRWSPSWLLVGSAACVACGASPQPVTPGPAASAAPPIASKVITPVELEADPRIVRCGVDDRPRSVVSSRDTDAHVSMRARNMLMKPVFEAVAPFPRGVPPSPDQPPALPRASATLGKSAPAFTTLAELDVCEGLATTADEGSVSFPVELSSSGAPLRVLPPASGAPSPYLRCVQERLCGLSGGAAGAKVSVPVAVKWNYARRVSPRLAADGTQVPRVTFEREQPEAHKKHAYTRVVKALVHHAATTCGFPGVEASMIVTLSFDKAFKVTGVKAEPTGPEVPAHVPTCVSERLKGEVVPVPPEPRPSDLAVVLDW